MANIKVNDELQPTSFNNIVVRTNYVYDSLLNLDQETINKKIFSFNLGDDLPNFKEDFWNNNTSILDSIAYNGLILQTLTDISEATTSKSGYMSSEDKVKLDSLSNYSLPAATSGALGGIRIGYTATGKNYPVVLDSNNRAYVNVPWESGGSYTLPTAGASTLGGIKTGYSTSGKNYKVQVDSSGNGYVNVPWTDSNTTYSQATSNSLGLVKIGYTESGDNYAVKLDGSGKMYVTVPVSSSGSSDSDAVIIDISNRVSGATWFNMDATMSRVTLTAFMTGMDGEDFMAAVKEGTFNRPLYIKCVSGDYKFIVPATACYWNNGGTSFYDGVVITAHVESYNGRPDYNNGCDIVIQADGNLGSLVFLTPSRLDFGSILPIDDSSSISTSSGDYSKLLDVFGTVDNFNILYKTPYLAGTIKFISSNNLYTVLSVHGFLVKSRNCIKVVYTKCILDTNNYDDIIGVKYIFMDSNGAKVASSLNMIMSYW